MEFQTRPQVEERPEVATLGIRTVTPFRTMLTTRDQLLAELLDWLATGRIEVDGPFFLRLQIVDMSGPMDLELGVMKPPADAPADDRVRRGSGRPDATRPWSTARCRCRPTARCSPGSTSRA